MRSFDAFISYRVSTDSKIARKIFDGLKENLKVFLDGQKLKPGLPWKSQFLKALSASIVFIPVISYETLESIRDRDPEQEDNVLLEWESALNLKQEMEEETLILPIFIVQDGRFDFSRVQLPETPRKNCTLSPREIWNQLTQNQGFSLNADDDHHIELLSLKVNDMVKSLKIKSPCGIFFMKSKSTKGYLSLDMDGWLRPIADRSKATRFEKNGTWYRVSQSGNRYDTWYLGVSWSDGLGVFYSWPKCDDFTLTDEGVFTAASHACSGYPAKYRVSDGKIYCNDKDSSEEPLSVTWITFE